GQIGPEAVRRDRLVVEEVSHRLGRATRVKRGAGRKHLVQERPPGVENGRRAGPPGTPRLFRPPVRPAAPRPARPGQIWAVGSVLGEAEVGDLWIEIRNTAFAFGFRTSEFGFPS